jgi:hypothetical protein
VLMLFALFTLLPLQLIFSIRSQGGNVVASPTLPDCQVVAGSKR